MTQETMAIKPEFLAKIKSGEKKIEFRSWLSDARRFSLVNEKTGKIEAIIDVAEVIDTKDFPEEDLEEMYDAQGISEEFREEYDCRYAYLIQEVHSVH